MIDKFDIYRIADPIFRVHARLFKVHEAILLSSHQQIKAARIRTAAQGTLISSFLLFLITLIVQVSELKLTSAPVVVLIFVFVAVLFAYGYDYVKLKDSEKEFERLMDQAGSADVEGWVDYAQALIAAYGARLKMLADMEEELGQQLKEGKIVPKKHNERLQYYAEVRAFCMDKLAHYKQLNEELFKKKKRIKEDYEQVKRFIASAEIGLSAPSSPDTGSAPTS
jgi:hypothetical protein